MTKKIKDSKYYLKKADRIFSLKWALIGGVVGLTLGLTFMGVKFKIYDEEHAELREETGYQQVIQEDLDYLELLNKNGEISSDNYNDRKKTLLYKNFEGYLKEKNDMASLAKLEEIEDKSFNNPKYVGVTLGLIAGTYGLFVGSDLLYHVACKKKGEKLRKEEQIGYIEIDI